MEEVSVPDPTGERDRELFAEEGDGPFHEIQVVQHTHFSEPIYHIRAYTETGRQADRRIITHIHTNTHTHRKREREREVREGERERPVEEDGDVFLKDSIEQAESEADVLQVHGDECPEQLPVHEVGQRDEGRGRLLWTNMHHIHIYIRTYN